MNEPPPIPKPEQIEPQTNTSLSSIFEGLLKSPKNLIAGITSSETQGAFTSKLLLLALVGFVIFGVTMGSFSFHEQLWAAPLKTILGLTFSTIICLPSLYVFSALTGTSLGIKEIVQGMAGALALIAALLLGFTPVLWVFSQSTTSEVFFGFLVLATWLIALFFGTGFLLKMLEQSGTKNKGPLRVWIGIFLLVTLQMSTTLRPLIGRSDSLFTTEKRFFLEHWGMTMNGPSRNSQVDKGQKAQPPEGQGKGGPQKRGASKQNPYLGD
ncbi:hypothetical protein N8529_00435 [bacterium]|nr:hypothetical protein [bacterium]